MSPKGDPKVLEAGAPFELAPGLWRWERRHPEWHPGEFGAVVASYVARVEDLTLFIDPLVDGESDPALAALDRLVQGRVRIVVTIPYHTRSAELFAGRYRGHDGLILGHPLVRKRLADTSAFRDATAGHDLQGVVRLHRIGRPVRAEMPIEIPALRALAFGDAVVEHAGALRLWEAPLRTENRRRWYDERFLPTVRRLTDLQVDRILVTHGRAVLTGGGAALVDALDRGPWQPSQADAGS